MSTDYQANITARSKLANKRKDKALTMTTKQIIKIYDANKIPSLTDEGILDYLSYQLKSDYRTFVKIERLTEEYAVKVIFEEQL